MRSVSLFAGVLILGAAAPLWSRAVAEPQAMSLNFAVTRDGAPIGTTTIDVRRSGSATTVRTATHIRVKFAYWTVYHFDQTETEDLANGRLIAMRSVTDDNGTVHKVDATNHGSAIAVDTDGKISRVDPTAIPANPWNHSLLRSKVALNPQDGSVSAISVIDRGEEQLMLHGRPIPAHHYSIETNYPQDVWYDQNQQLVMVELHGSDGSRIRYRPG